MAPVLEVLTLSNLKMLQSMGVVDEGIRPLRGVIYVLCRDRYVLPLEKCSITRELIKKLNRLADRSPTFREKIENLDPEHTSWGDITRMVDEIEKFGFTLSV